MKRLFLTSFLILTLSPSFYALFSQGRVYPSELFSRAEKTQFEETTLSYEVRNFVNTLSELSDDVTVEVFGQSLSGQDLQLVIMADPRITTPEEAKASGKPIIYIQGNIHAGEVEGKEAIMTLMREIAFEEKHYLLDNQIILFCPNYNPDGNDKLADNNRGSQDGSPLLAGERASGEGFDLNREGLKLEALEAKALVKNVFGRWDPALFVDLHTDNGSWHGYAVNFAPSFHSAGQIEPTTFTKENIFPWIQTDILNRSGIQTWWHGYYRNRAGQTPVYSGYSHQPRYMTNYVGLRNRMGILSESFAHQLFELRYEATYRLIESILRYTNDHAEEVVKLIADADKETIETIKQQAGKLQKGVRYKLTDKAEVVSILARETVAKEDKNGRRRTRGTGKIYWQDSVKHFNSFVPTMLSTVPKAYYFSKDFSAIADKLKEHGIEVEQLDTRIKMGGEQFLVQKYKKNSRSRYPGHNPVTLEGIFEPAQKTFKAGDYKVSLEQPLAWLIFYLLEPQSDDGLVFWNFFDEYLEKSDVSKKKVFFPIAKEF